MLLIVEEIDASGCPGTSGADKMRVRMMSAGHVIVPAMAPLSAPMLKLFAAENWDRSPNAFIVFS